MKRLLLLTSIFFLSVVTLHAQDQQFHFGFKFAPTLAWIKPDTKGLDRDGSKLGFSYGVVTEFRIQDNYAFATGLQVTYRGGDLTYRRDNNPLQPVYSYGINLQYIEIPLTLKMKTNEFNKIRYFGQFGFEPGFNIRARAKANMPGFDDEENFKDFIKPLNLSMIIGAGAEYTISGSTVLVGSLEFNNGFVDILDTQRVYDPLATPPGVVDTEWKGSTNFFALNIGLLF